MGSNNYQIGFTVRSPNGTIIYQRTNGTGYSIGTVFATFCPLACTAAPTLNLSITMSDSFGDGWNGNILAVVQNNGVVGTFGGNFLTGSSKGPIYIVVQGNVETQVVVQQLGSMTS